MPCPKCDDEPFLGEYDRDFALTRYHVDVSQPATFEVDAELDTVLRIDGDIYWVEPLQEQDPAEVRESIDGLLQDEVFEKAVDELPYNLPQAYDEDAYLSRHLPDGPAGFRDDLREIAEEHDLTPRSALLLAYVESKNNVLGKSDDTLGQYIQVRDSLASHLDDEGGVTPRIQREFVAHLLLATALMEELTAEALFREVYREEHRLGANSQRIRRLAQSQRLGILSDCGILSNSLKSKIESIKDLRDSLVHDPKRRTAMEERHEAQWVDEKLEAIDHAVGKVLDLTGKTAARVIAEHGPSDYVASKCSLAVREARQHWSENHHGFDLIAESDIVSLNSLQWEIDIGSMGHREVVDGVDFSCLPSSEEGASTSEIRMYQTLMEFLQSCEDFLVRRIEADLEHANLDRQDFLILCLLCDEDSTYQGISERLGSTPEYIQRKENVLAWRSSQFEKEVLGELPKPESPIAPFSR